MNLPTGGMYVGRIFEKSTRDHKRARRNRDAERVVVAWLCADERLVRIFEMKVPRQLFRGRIAYEATISQCLVVREKADWHRFTLCRCRGSGPALGQQFAGPLSRLSFGVDIGIACRHRYSELDSDVARGIVARSEEQTSELQSLMRISYAVLRLKKKELPSH